MSLAEIDFRDVAGGLELPSDVADTVKQASDTLEQLVEDDGDHISTKWCRFTLHAEAGWIVTLQLRYDGTGSDSWIVVDQLKDLTVRKHHLWLALTDFAEWLRRDALKNLRRIEQTSRELAEAGV